MYTPKAFQEERLDVLHALMQQHSFATLVTVVDGMPVATHMPFVLDRTRGEFGTLISHLARANPQWQHFSDEQEALVIFQGAHAYVSPSFYESDFAVPTWNYAAVHAYGHPRIVEEPERVQAMLDELVAVYESQRPQPWSVPWADERYGKLTGGLVGFEMTLTRLEGKAKMSQNRPLADRRGVIEGLSAASHPDERAVAQMMTDNIAIH